MKFLSALVLGLVAAVNAQEAPPSATDKIDAIFSNTPMTLFSYGGASLVQTLNWDFVYGTYYNAYQGLITDYHSENYGFALFTIVTADYHLNLFNGYVFDVQFQFLPFNFAPVDIWLNFERFVHTASPMVTLQVNSLTQIGYFQAYYYEAAAVENFSIKDAIHTKATQWTPTSANWAPYFAPTVLDPYWVFDTVAYAVTKGYIPTIAMYGTYNYFTHSHTL